MTDKSGWMSADAPIIFGEITCLIPVHAVNNISKAKALKVLLKIKNSITDQGKSTIIGPIIGNKSTKPKINAIGIKYSWPKNFNTIAIRIEHISPIFSCALT